MPPFCAFLHLLLWLCFSFISFTNLSKAIPNPDCPTKCGDLNVPYPFGIGPDCSIGSWYDIICDTTFDPPKPLLSTGHLELPELEVLEISTSKLRVKNFAASTCYTEFGKVEDQIPVTINLKGSPFTLSQENKCTLFGCHDHVFVSDAVSKILTSCSSRCNELEDFVDQPCRGVGCCRVGIPKGLQRIQTFVDSESTDQRSNVYPFNPCSVAILGDQTRVSFSKSDLGDPGFPERIAENVPLILDWKIGNQSCSDVENSDGYVCKKNSKCTDVDDGVRGYRCNCVKGYQGNPYLSSGCLDINECKTTPCHPKGVCSNFPGGFSCTCPVGHIGDGLKDGTGCISEGSNFPVKNLSLGISFGFLALIISVVWLYYTVRKRKLIKLRQKYFHQNGGVLLKQKISTNGVNSESGRIFTLEEIKKATNNYSKDRILGKGGFGIVYKGILDDKRVVAIKTSKTMDETQIETFINEVDILTQVNHRNVVKLVGCCLETKVPQLVYEYVSNGTLSEHIEHCKEKAWFSFEDRLRIAYEAATAFAYLHSAASPPIIHRDVKSDNILLDEHYIAKVADFGGSRLIPLDQTRVSTIIMGTRGYLDPEYLNSGQLTEKSDVYSFGVVLAELLTGKKPFSPNTRVGGDGTLAKYFILAKKEGHLFDILEARVKREGSFEQINDVAELVIRCLELEGEHRPTMKQVVIALERVRKMRNQGYTEQEYDDGIGDLYSVDTSLHHPD